MRPQSIVYFERVYLLDVVLGLASIVAFWPELRRMVAAAQLAIVSALLLGLVATLVLLVSRRRSRIATWILVAVTLAGMAFSLPSLPASVAAGSRGWLGAAQTLLQIAALAFLSTPPARAWLRRAGPAA